ncbi:cohesin domain-containing protein [Sideroxydans lithotrophicus]|uniref:Type II and III secretion system protein n=1 Tax=Sideroxydans lithotrophicus (strain ES-1) TaxID=580332 RepID=D5CSW8_SIDLE|nr:cohesin domain-containing protein [Sideroxydans lithotrophicus]ADE12054.1 type II and III secretion system protein [Sideroxydans lithotrophicus ES-1]
MTINYSNKRALSVLLAAILIGCADQGIKVLDLNDESHIEDGLAKLERQAKEHPHSMDRRADLLRERDRAINFLLLSGDRLHDQGRDEEAYPYYRRVLAIDRDNTRAREGTAAIEKAKRHKALLAEANALFDKGDLEAAQNKLQDILIENPDHAQALALRRQIQEKQAMNTEMQMPTLKSKFRQPVTLQFRDANLKMVFEALSRSSGINILLDRDMRNDLKASIFVKDASVADALDLILMQNQLEKKVLNDSTVFIYPNTPAKIKEYQDLVIRTFQLTNADAKQMQTMIKTMLKTKDIYVNEKNNSLIIRDTPEAVKMAEKLIASQDINEPEVMLEVEVLEVLHSKLTQLGVKWPNQLGLSVNATPATSTATTTSGGAVVTTNTPAVPLTVNGLRHINGDAINVTPLSMTLDLRKELGDSNLLASPRIRVKQHEKAKIMIGDRVPVITNSVTPVATGTPVVTGSVQYLDVGLKLEVEPDIHMDGEVAIKTYLEVSTIANQVTNAASGSVAYQIGTRNVNTVLRLKDGETQVLAGLINDEDRKSSASVPGLGDLPILGHLFSSNGDDKRKTEIILSITPHIIRNIHRPDVDLAEFWSGTEDTLRNRPLSLQPVGMVNTGSATMPALQALAQAAPFHPQPVMPALPAAGAAPAPLQSQQAAVPLAQAAPAASPGGIVSQPEPVTQAASPQVLAVPTLPVVAALAPGKLLPGVKPATPPLMLSWQGASQAKVGDQFKVVVYAQTGSKVVDVPLKVVYDPAALQVVDVAEGDFLKGNNAQTVFSSNVDPTGGQVSVDVSQPGLEGAGGRGSLAVLTFKVTAANPQVPISVSGSAVNAAGDQVKVNLPAPHNVALLP